MCPGARIATVVESCSHLSRAWSANLPRVFDRLESLLRHNLMLVLVSPFQRYSTALQDSAYSTRSALMVIHNSVAVFLLLTDMRVRE